MIWPFFQLSDQTAPKAPADLLLRLWCCSKSSSPLGAGVVAGGLGAVGASVCFQCDLVGVKRPLYDFGSAVRTYTASGRNAASSGERAPGYT